jgi:RNA polymerase sigma factor (TIGR02999 family)
MNEVTRILVAIDRGDVRAADKLLPVVYQELRRLAAQQMNKESPGQTLQATALVHEAYLRLIGSENQGWRSRGHFFCAAAEAMRRILIEIARKKKSLRSGGGHKRIDLDEALVTDEQYVQSDSLLALDEALEKLEQKDKVKADVVKLRYFAGLTIEETAKVMGLSPATAKRYWVYARARLLQEIG